MAGLKNSLRKNANARDANTQKHIAHASHMERAEMWRDRLRDKDSPIHAIYYDSMMRQINQFVQKNKRLPRRKEWNKVVALNSVKLRWVVGTFGGYKNMLRETGWGQRIILMYRELFVKKYRHQPSSQEWLRFSTKYNVPYVNDVRKIFGSFEKMNAMGVRSCLSSLEPVERPHFNKCKDRVLGNALKACKRIGKVPRKAKRQPNNWTEWDTYAKKIPYMPTRQTIYTYFNSWEEFLAELNKKLAGSKFLQ